jgi:hypothetical protein
VTLTDTSVQYLTKEIQLTILPVFTYCHHSTLGISYQYIAGDFVNLCSINTNSVTWIKYGATRHLSIIPSDESFLIPLSQVQCRVYTGTLLDTRDKRSSVCIVSNCRLTYPFQYSSYSSIQYIPLVYKNYHEL